MLFFLKGQGVSRIFTYINHLAIDLTGVAARSVIRVDNLLRMGDVFRRRREYLMNGLDLFWMNREFASKSQCFHTLRLLNKATVVRVV